MLTRKSNQRGGGPYSGALAIQGPRLFPGLHYFMALPAALLFGVFFVFPLVQGLGMSLTEWNGMGSPKFVGFRNFVDFFQDSRAIHDIQNTLRNCTEIT